MEEFNYELILFLMGLALTVSELVAELGKKCKSIITLFLYYCRKDCGEEEEEEENDSK